MDELQAEETPWEHSANVSSSESLQEGRKWQARAAEKLKVRAGIKRGQRLFIPHFLNSHDEPELVRKEKLSRVSPDYQKPEEVRIILKYWFYSRLLGCVGLLFLFITLITPYWLRINSSLSRISLGLWSLCAEYSCRILSGNSPILNSCRILLSMSTLCGLVAVSASLISNPRLGQSKWPLITSLTTALLSFLAILLFSLSVANQINLTEEEHAPFTYGLSFSFVGGCIGCILFCISGLLFVLIKIKESAIIFPTCPARPEQKKQSRVAEKKV